ncbi:hypothetical protein Hanom_Chr00s118068g01810501 [Helianthus anomalus]
MIIISFVFGIANSDTKVNESHVTNKCKTWNWAIIYEIQRIILDTYSGPQIS